ncbi:MAG: ribonuclease Z, partial [Anaerovoracaceae bacterium]
MIIIACVDQANGMTFNHRRQSRDSAVIKDILRQTQEKILWMSPYSYGLFSGNLEKENLIQVEEQLLGRVGKGEYCFMEDFPQGDEEDIEGVILYRWDKTYPAETRFPLDLQAP